MQEEVKQELGGFNPLVVHIRNEETKRFEAANPFKVIAHKGVRFYEWPVSSANLWYEDRTPAGRLGDDGVPIRDAKHVVFVPVVTEDQKVGEQNQVLAQENKRLQAELADIKREQDIVSKLGNKPQAVAKGVQPNKPKTN